MHQSALDNRASENGRCISYRAYVGDRHLLLFFSMRSPNPIGWLALAALCSLAHAIDNGIGVTPPQGWRSWVRISSVALVKNYHGPIGAFTPNTQHQAASSSWSWLSCSSFRLSAAGGGLPFPQWHWW